eukprot:m.207952 g.207952  ORF g.207952 m.207952 type:complete len:139 (-) comp16921_c9_seq2:1904-2320(-)
MKRPLDVSTSSRSKTLTLPKQQEIMRKADEQQAEAIQAGSQPAIQTAASDGLHPLDYTPTAEQAGVPLQPVDESTWTKDTSKEWRSLLSQALTITYSRSRTLCCLLTQIQYFMFVFLYKSTESDIPFPLKTMTDRSST